MKLRGRTLPPCSWVLVTAILAILLGCGDDNSQSPKPATYDSPTGNWNVTSSNLSAVIVDSDLPSAVVPYVEQWLKDLISNGGNSQWNTNLVTVVLTATESPTCIPLPLAYSSANRSCTTPLTIQVQDLDVSALDLCVTISEIPPVEYCITTLSIDATATPNLQWAEDYKTFSGDEKIGTAQNPASTTVTITGPVIGGTYSITFYGSRDVSGSRCSSCKPCQ